VGGPSIRIDGNGNLHIQISLRHHPGEQFQTAARFLVRRRQIGGQQVRFQTRPPVVPLADGLLFGLLERAADDQPQAPVVGDKRGDSARGERQRIGGEVAGHAVVLNGAGEGRIAEQLDQVAIFLAKAGAPLAVG